jgi:ferrous iron transport protein A
MTGDRVIISEIDAGRGAAMNLACLGLHIGDVIRLERRSPFRGPLTVVHRGSEIAIGFSLAQKILVTKA